MSFQEKLSSRVKSICEKNKLTAKCYSLCEKNIELIRYAFWGVATTLFNMVIYLACSRLIFNFIFKDSFSLSFYDVILGELTTKTYSSEALVALFSNTLAWFFAVAFAFFVNQSRVFRDNSTGFERFKKLLQFYLLRVFSGAFEIILPSLLIITLSTNDLIAKIIASVFVIILNYITAKFITFRKSKKASNDA